MGIPRLHNICIIMMLAAGSKLSLNFQKANLGKERTDPFLGVEDHSDPVA